MKIWQLLSRKENWTQGADGRNKTSRSVSALSPSAICWCLYGAVARCYAREDHDEILWMLTDALSPFQGHIPPEAAEAFKISNWNDQADRTHQEVHLLAKTLDV